MMENEIVKEISATVEESAPAEPTSPEASQGAPVEPQAIASIFGLRPESLSPKEVSRIQTIVDWARAEHPDEMDLRWLIIQKRNTMAPPRVGETYLDKMYQWVSAYTAMQVAERNLRIAEDL